MSSGGAVYYVGRRFASSERRACGKQQAGQAWQKAGMAHTYGLGCKEVCRHSMEPSQAKHRETGNSQRCAVGLGKRPS